MNALSRSAKCDRESQREIFRSRWERLLGKTDSPIEGEFLDNFCVLSQEYGFDVAPRSKASNGMILVYPQKNFAERYRADFMIVYPFFDTEFTAIVECDGHQFHEKTKSQAARDRRRDRVCNRLGYNLFRFTGSEIRNDPAGCAFEVIDAIMAFQTAQLTANTRPALEESAEAAE